MMVPKDRMSEMGVFFLSSMTISSNLIPLGVYLELSSTPFKIFKKLRTTVYTVWTQGAMTLWWRDYWKSVIIESSHIFYHLKNVILSSGFLGLNAVQKLGFNVLKTNTAKILLKTYLFWDIYVNLTRIKYC